MTFNKFFNCETIAGFNSALESGTIEDPCIVFIEETKQIWTHGQFYSCPYTKEEIDNMFNSGGSTITKADVERVLTGNITSHTHSYLPLTGTAANASKVANSLTLKINSGTTEGTNQYIYNGSSAKSLDIKAGSNVTLTASSGALTISSTNTTYGLASSTSNGLMSKEDKVKLNGVEAGAQVNDVTSVAGRIGAVVLTKSDVGLGNVTNESKATMFTNASLTGTPTAPTASSSTNSTQIATTAFVQSLVNSKIAASDAMIYKGTIGSSGATITSLPDTTAKTGWTYKVLTAGTYAGQKCEVGDMIICLTDGSTSTAATWTVIQTNIDGAVTGPSSSVDSHVVTFNGSTGKIVKDSGFTIAKSVPSDAKFTDTIYTLPTASSSVLGGVKIGSNITLSSGVISLTKDNVTSALGYTPPTSNTTYSAGTGLTLTGTSFSLSNSGVTAGSYGPTANVSGSNGTTINVPQITVDAMGRVTSVTNRVYTSVDNNTTYSVVGANGSTGLVKNGSSVTSASGYTACPIISGVPYYKDTNTTYTLGSFGITATAAELNYCDGVTSNIQTQLNAKAASSHTHSYLPLSGGTMTGNITYSSKGNCYIGSGDKDAASSVGGALGNLVISSWQGVSFTTSCTGTYAGKTAVGINCRTGQVYAAGFTGPLAGNSSTSTKLATARTINGTGFDGSANITTVNWGTARTLTIGSTGKSVNGSGNVSWSLSEIGAAAASHTHTNIVSRGEVTAESGVTGRPAVEGLSMTQAYNNGYPAIYGNVISLRGKGDGQIFVGWSGTDGAHAPVYVRSKRDVTTANWSPWAQFYTSANPQPSVTGSSGSCTGNAATATKLATARTISLTGSVTGSASFDGSTNITISTSTLNADMLDGTHLAGFSGREGVMRSWLRGRYTTVNQYFGNGNVVTIDPKPTDDTSLSANTTILSLGDNANRNTQLAFYYESDTIRYRRCTDSGWTGWATLLNSSNWTGYVTYIPRDRGSNTVSTLSNLPTTKSTVIANLSAATSISVASGMNVGESITVICNPTASFTQPIPTTGSYKSMDGSSLSVTSRKQFEINIYCYASNTYSISCKVAK